MITSELNLPRALLRLKRPVFAAGVIRISLEEDDKLQVVISEQEQREQTVVISQSVIMIYMALAFLPRNSFCSSASTLLKPAARGSSLPQRIICQLSTLFTSCEFGV
jgi:hypothetical protein